MNQLWSSPTSPASTIRPFHSSISRQTFAPELGIAVVAGSGFDSERTLAHVASKIRTTAKMRIVVCPKLPMLPTGKIDRSALAALFG